jgi:hypothetical protein
MLAHLASLVEQDAWEHTWEDEDDDEPQQPIPAPIFQALHPPFILQPCFSHALLAQNHKIMHVAICGATRKCRF